MTAHVVTEPSALRRAAAATLAAVAETDAELVAVVGRLAGVADAVRARVVAPGAATRAVVGAAVAASGRRVVTVLDEGTVVASRATAGGGGGTALQDIGTHVLLVAGVEAAAAARAVGTTVVQPAWACDVDALLRAALAGRGTVAIRLDGDAPAGPDRPLPAPVLGAPRLLRRGYAVTVVGSGRTVPLLSKVVRLLAGRGIEAGAVELHTLPPAQGPGPLEFDDALYVARAGSVDAVLAQGAAGARLRPVPVGEAEPHVVADAVLAVTRA